MYQYPQRPGAVAGPPATAFAPQSQQTSYAPPPPPPIVAPGTTLYSVASGSLTSLRLKPSDALIAEPPVYVPPELLPGSSPSAAADAAMDLGLERGLLDAPQVVDAEQYVQGLQEGGLPMEGQVKQVVSSGATYAAAALGVAFGRGGRGSDKAADFASKVDQLTGMGFALSAAAGALAKHGNDVEAATEACLALAS